MFPESHLSQTQVVNSLSLFASLTLRIPSVPPFSTHTRVRREDKSKWGGDKSKWEGSTTVTSPVDKYLSSRILFRHRYDSLSTCRHLSLGCTDECVPSSSHRFNYSGSDMKVKSCRTHHVPPLGLQECTESFLRAPEIFPTIHSSLDHSSIFSVYVSPNP